MADNAPIPSARPANVAAAMKLLYATLGIGVLRSVVEFHGLSEAVPAEFIVTVWVLVITIMLTLFHNIGVGRNWARIVFLVLFVAGLPFSIEPLLLSLSSNVVSGILGVAQMAGQITALIMLFRPDSNAWFRKPTKPDKPTESVEF
jgi:hypothetical protein